MRIVRVIVILRMKLRAIQIFSSLRCENLSIESEPPTISALLSRPEILTCPITHVLYFFLVNLIDSFTVEYVSVLINHILSGSDKSPIKVFRVVSCTHNPFLSIRCLN